MDNLTLNNKKDNFLQVIINFSVILITSIFVGILLLLIVYSIPTNLMAQHVIDSSDVLYSEGGYYTYGFWGMGIGTVDNFTDAIMINTAYYNPENFSFLEKVLLNFRYGTSVTGLNNLVSGNPDEIVSYARYWHGYLVFLKPLLLVFNITQIRTINLVVQTLLVACIVALMWKKKKSLIIPYLVSLIIISPFIISRTLQYSWIYYIFNIAILLLLIFNEKLKNKNHFGYFFAMIGMATSFFDLLTYPIATIGMPLIVYIALNNKESFKENFKDIVKLCVFWGLGYGLFWASKWIISSIIFGENYILEGLSSVFGRMNSSTKAGDSWLKIHTSPIVNLRRLFNFIFVIVLLVTFIVVDVLFIMRKVKNKKSKVNRVNVWTYLIIAFIPVCWFLVAANHTYEHIFPCRTYAVTFFALYMMMFEFYTEFKEQIKQEETVTDENLVKGKKIAVLLPCYNEHLTIKNTINRYKEALPEADIYVYDNNSTDGSDKIALECGAIVRYEKKQGKGNVVKSMFEQIDADCYFMVDADDTYMPENARQMCDLVLSGKADMVNGDRLSSTYMTEEKRKSHTFGNKLVRFLINLLYKNKIKDIMTGQRAFSKRFVKNFEIKSKGFEIETEMTIFASDNNLVVEEIPVRYVDRPKGSFSKLNTYKDGFKVLMTIFKSFFKNHTGQFLCYASLSFLCLGLIFMLPSVILSMNAIKNAVLMWLVFVSFMLFIIVYFVGAILTKLKDNKPKKTLV